MTKYVLQYFGGDMPEGEADQAAVIKEWQAWFTSLGNAVVDSGNPFGPVAKKIASDGTVTDGPVGPMATGYSILTAESFDQAVLLAKGCPGLKAGTEISVFEVFPAM